jgi:ribosomal protein S18 acetylase RimI-like enzyme
MFLVSKFSKLLSKKEIIEILKLKKSFWKFSLKSQMVFFNKHYYEFDINNLLYLNKKLVGYNILKKRSFFGKKKGKYYYLDTLIIDKSHRKKNYGSILMNLSNLLIKNYNSHAMLLCKKQNIKFYKRFDWTIDNNINNKLQDKNTNLIKLFFNKKSSKNSSNYYIYK